MAFVREHVPQEEWEFFNNLNIQYQREHITADKYTTWVIDREREIVFTNIFLSGRDYGHTYILIWGKSRVYIYVESRTVVFGDGTQKYHWDIECVTAPISLKGKREELASLIREVAETENDGEIGGIFIIDNIAEPQFVEGE